jgi:hypothetical protein
MADQKISQLTTITSVDNAADLFPIVDTSAAETKKITPTALKTALSLNNVDNTSDLNKPISNATQTALDGKVDENTAITGATKTKITYDAKGLVTAGADATTSDIADSTNKRYVTDAQLVVIGNTSGTNTGDNATNSQYSGLATSKQDTLVSGTNIKTINSTSLLGSGDIEISASPSGVAGAIQFSNGSAFSSDATNLFWDDTNNRLGVGTNAPTSRLHIKGTGATAATTSLLIQNSSGNQLLSVRDDGYTIIGAGNQGIASNSITISNFGNFGSGSGELPSAVLQANSTTKGFLPPRMTTTQKNAISSPASGLVVYDTTLGKLCVRGASAWETITSV